MTMVRASITPNRIARRMGSFTAQIAEHAGKAANSGFQTAGEQQQSDKQRKASFRDHAPYATPKASKYATPPLTNHEARGPIKVFP